MKHFLKKYQLITVMLICNCAVVYCANNGENSSQQVIRQDFSESTINFEPTLTEPFEFYYLGCVGTAPKQVVGFMFAIKNLGDYKDIKFFCEEAESSDGVKFSSDDMLFTAPNKIHSSVSETIFTPTNQQIYFVVRVNGVLPRATMFKYIKIKMVIDEVDSFSTKEKSIISFENVPIDWK